MLYFIITFNKINMHMEIEKNKVKNIIKYLLNNFSDK